MLKKNNRTTLMKQNRKVICDTNERTKTWENYIKELFLVEHIVNSCDTKIEIGPYISNQELALLRNVWRHLNTSVIDICSGYP